MFAFCGMKLRVFKVAHKTCDTIKNSGGRRMYDTVHLEGARCGGGDHGGCEARCQFFWKEAWLMRAESAATVADGPVPAVCTETDVRESVVAQGESPWDPDPTWVCQTTSLFDATHPLKWWDVSQYILDVRNGNHTLPDMFRMLSFGFFRGGLKLLRKAGIGTGAALRGYDAFQKWRGGRPYPVASGMIPMDQATPTESLELRPGEWVRIKTPEEIRSTLNVHGRNRGMWFDQEMIKFCGRTFPVDMRVTRIIDEKSGRMLAMKNPCIQLEGVHCEGECTAHRIGCPRRSNTYWREVWLERV
jgi:hypothetical protein